MATYLVTWTIDIEADSHRGAAERALAIHRNPESIATVFSVIETDTSESVRIDLTEDFTCTACGRPEAECSANPCTDVIADRAS